MNYKIDLPEVGEAAHVTLHIPHDKPTIGTIQDILHLAARKIDDQPPAASFRKRRQTR